MDRRAFIGYAAKAGAAALFAHTASISPPHANESNARRIYQRATDNANTPLAAVFTDMGSHIRYANDGGIRLDGDLLREQSTLHAIDAAGHHWRYQASLDDHLLEYTDGVTTTRHPRATLLEEDPQLFTEIEATYQAIAEPLRARLRLAGWDARGYELELRVGHLIGAEQGPLPYERSSEGGLVSGISLTLHHPYAEARGDDRLELIWDRTKDQYAITLSAWPAQRHTEHLAPQTERYTLSDAERRRDWEDATNYHLTRWEDASLGAAVTHQSHGMHERFKEKERAVLTTLHELLRAPRVFERK